MHMRRPPDENSLAVDFAMFGRGYGFCFCRKIVLFCSHQSRSREVRAVISDLAGPISFFLLIVFFFNFFLRYNALLYTFYDIFCQIWIDYKT